MSKEKNVQELMESISIDNNDINNLLQYIKHRQTAMLVIMFTDIKGFTEMTERMGDEYSARIRATHDEIMQSIIEENNAGKIIKYIGDAVMAVFAEPTAAVQKSLAIQGAFSSFNQQNPELEDINVRIGLHMGQVAIENNLQADIFGRHVNRASRIEGLADGGQIYMTYPVFDSAKGWLANHDNIDWKLHGEYFLKGIPKAAEIYEVYRTEKSEPAPPKKGKKEASNTFWTFLIAAALLGGLLSYGVLNYEATSVTLFAIQMEHLYMDNGERVFMDGDKTVEMRQSLTDMSPGRHILYYDVSKSLRYYAEIDVKAGENLIDPVFKEFRLPYGYFRHTLTPGETFAQSWEKDFDFAVYNDVQEKIEHSGTLYASITGEPLDEINYKYLVDFKVEVDGEIVAEKSLEFTHDVTHFDSLRTERIVFHEAPEYSFEYFLQQS